MRLTLLLCATEHLVKKSDLSTKNVDEFHNYKKQCVEKSVYVKGTRAWNSLSVTVRNIPNYNAFKTFNKNWLKDKVQNM